MKGAAGEKGHEAAAPPWPAISTHTTRLNLRAPSLLGGRGGGKVPGLGHARFLRLALLALVVVGDVVEEA